MIGFDINVADYDGRTAMHLAACEGHIHIIQFLVNTAKAKFDVKDRSTPFITELIK
jgi:ankyrin repeat protein